MKRRSFIHAIAGVSSGFFLPYRMPSQLSEVTFGIVADVHKDLVPDADQRLEAFINEAKNREIDLIIQLGDFCMAVPENKTFLNIWNSFKGSKHHVLGNHDMDKNTKAEMLDFWEMKDTYYSFDFKGLHFIILDANFIYQDGKYYDYKNANFYIDSANRTFIHPEQIEWLQSDLESTKLPTLVFSHQSLSNYHWGVRNRLAVQKILEAHSDKIICCMNGHDHIDYHHQINGVNYIEINSMSYFWMASKYKSYKRFPKELYDQYNHLANLAMYQEPLYAFAKCSKQGLTIEGVQSQWVAPSPAETGMPQDVEGSRCTPEISNYVIKKP